MKEKSMAIIRTDLIIPTYDHPDGFTARVRDGRVQIVFSDIQGTTTIDVPVGALAALCSVVEAVQADHPAPEPAPVEPEGDPEQPVEGPPEEPSDDEPQEEP